MSVEPLLLAVSDVVQAMWFSQHVDTNPEGKRMLWYRITQPYSVSRDRWLGVDANACICNQWLHDFLSTKMIGQIAVYPLQ